MIIYGTNATHLKTAISDTTVCPNCGTRGSIAFSVFSRHAHVFWIPIFPIGKTGGSKCQTCQHEMQHDKMSHEFKREYFLLKMETLTPLWQFSGMALISVLVVWGFINGNVKKKNLLEFIGSPVAEDVYEFQAGSNSFSTLKVVETTQDSVVIVQNDYETNRKTGVDDIEKNENYSGGLYLISKADIRKMYDEGKIYDIRRKK